MIDKNDTHFGPYKLLEKIGQGGMGEVWKARDTRLDRTVAIKKCAARFSERFEREARSIAALNHAHICTLYDVGPDYLVMEYIDGHPLKGPMPLDEALRAAAEIADALDTAHSHGIVHRDLKPANILVNKSGVKLLDFGLARQDGAAAGAPREENPTRTITGEGVILGTPQYMAPEQIEGRPADARSDIFSFGCVLYEMLTGAKAFEGKSPSSVIAAIIAREPRPVHELQPSVPPAVERILETCLAKDPEQRWQTARDLKHVIESVMGGETDVAPAARRVWPARLAWVLAAVFLAAAAILGVFLWRGETAKPQAVRFGITTPEEAGVPRFAVVSPDGKQIVIPARGSDGKVRLWLRTLDSDHVRPIPQTEGAGNAFWSPDGRSIAFVAAGSLKRMDLAGGEPRTICAAAGAGAGGSWNAGGVIVFATYRGPIQRVAAQGGAPSAVTKLDPAADERYHVNPGFLPDQRHFLYTSWGGNQGQAKIGSVDGKVDLKLAITGGPFMFVPPDHLLFGREGSIMAQRFEPGKLRLKGDPVRVAEPVAPFSTAVSYFFPFSVSQNGVLAWRTGSPGSQNRLVWRNEAGTELDTVGQPAEYSNLALSPDGQRLAVDILEAASKTRDIWIFDLARGSRTRFTNNPADDHNATWSPDGTEIAFTSNRKVDRDLYVKPADGSREERLLVELPGQENLEWWSPDGKHLIFNRQLIGPATSLWMLPVRPGAALEPALLVGGSQNQAMAQISPDGKFIAYSTSDPRGSVIHVQDFPPKGPRWQVSLESGTGPQWRRDGRVLYYLDRTGEKAVLMAVDVGTAGATFSPGRPRKLFECQLGRPRRNAYLAGPGNRLLFVEPIVEQPRAPITVLVNWQAALER